MRRVVHICSQNGVNWRRVGQPSSGVSDGYTWDAAGNPHYSEIDNHAIYYGVNELNQMTSFGFAGVGTAMHTFDANGSLVHSAPYYPEKPIDTWSYTYDAKSRLTSASRRAYGATDFELVVSNRYDHLDSGAGGVGGLLYLAISNSSTRQLYVPWYDAYGNVMGYWDAQGNVVAEYTYDAFGKLIIEKGSDFSV